jgi:hypothetical protein
MVSSPSGTAWTSFILGVNVDNDLIFLKSNGRVWRERIRGDMTARPPYAARVLAALGDCECKLPAVLAMLLFGVIVIALLGAARQRRPLPARVVPASGFS